MPPSQLRNVGKFISAASLAVTLVFLPTSTGFSSVVPSPPARAVAPAPAPHAPLILANPTAPTAQEPAIETPPEFLKEQAMTHAELMARWAPLIKEASKRFKVSEDWIRAVMRMESGGRTFNDDKRPITSVAGAMGVMQVMPTTYEEMRQQYGLGNNPYDPHDNVIAGTAYLHWLEGKYGYPKMFAAYNAGPGTLEALTAGTRTLPAETRAYVKGIGRILGAELVVEPTPSSRALSAPAEPVSVVAMLTRPDGSQIPIDSAVVDSIRAPLTNEYIAGVQTVLAMGQKRQGVREDLATVAAALHRPGLIVKGQPLDDDAPGRILHVYN